MAGKQSAKAGRSKSRPSNMAYTAAKRWVTNKAKKAIKHAKRMEEQFTRLLQVPRGTARDLARYEKQQAYQRAHPTASMLASVDLPGYEGAHQ